MYLLAGYYLVLLRNRVHLNSVFSKKAPTRHRLVSPRIFQLCEASRHVVVNFVLAQFHGIVNNDRPRVILNRLGGGCKVVATSETARLQSALNLGYDTFWCRHLVPVEGAADFRRLK